MPGFAKYCALAGLALLLPSLAMAASSSWHEIEGGSLRMVVEDFPANGVRRAALEIRLAPGWKTYWMDPGESGVPPQIEIRSETGSLTPEILFPPPKRVDDGNSVWAGYDASLGLAMELPGSIPPDLEAEIFLGICQSICIPVSARLDVRQSGVSSPEEAMALESAFARLPLPAGKENGIAEWRLEGESLVARMAGPAPDAELFLASDGGWQFGVPVREGDRFTIPLLERPEPISTSKIQYTLVRGDGAVRGTFDFGGE